MRDIEAFHTVRRILQPEIPAQFLHRAHRLCIRLLDAGRLIRQIFLGIAPCHLQDVVLRTALGHQQLNLRFPLALRQPGFQQCPVLCCQFHWQQHLARNERRPVVILLQERLQDRGITFLLTALQQEVLPANHLAGPDKEDLHHHAQFRARHANGILIPGTRDDILLLGHLAYSQQLIAQPAGQLKMIRLRRSLHAELQLPLHIFRASLQEQQHRMDHRIVVAFFHLACAGCQAPPDMIFEAWPFLQVLTGPQRKQPPQELQAFMHRCHIRIRTKVTCSVLEHPPRDEYPREILLHRHLHIRIALIILQTDIIARPMLLDEIAFQDQRLDLRMRHDDLKISNMRNHRPHLRRVILV